MDHPSAYLDAIEENDFETAHKVLLHLYGNYLNAYNKDSYTKDVKSQAYWTAAEHIYKAEMQWLLPQNDVDANRRLIYTLDDMNPIGEEPLAGNPYGYIEMKKKRSYMEFAEHYNKICLEMVKIAVHNGNQEMAKQLLSMFKNGYTISKSEDNYIFTPNNADLQRAQAIVQNSGD